jgi:hypothetical protein
MAAICSRGVLPGSGLEKEGRFGSKQEYQYEKLLPCHHFNLFAVNYL